MQGHHPAHKRFNVQAHLIWKVGGLTWLRTAFGRKTLRYHQIALWKNPIVAVRETSDAITMAVCLQVRLRYQILNDVVAYIWAPRRSRREDDDLTYVKFVFQVEYTFAAYGETRRSRSTLLSGHAQLQGHSSFRLTLHRRVPGLISLAR